ncbi:MAG: hypothetical protein ACLUFV_00885 [Acutalibacteraceae bacterium]
MDDDFYEELSDVLIMSDVGVGPPRKSAASSAPA